MSVSAEDICEILATAPPGSLIILTPESAQDSPEEELAEFEFPADLGYDMFNNAINQGNIVNAGTGGSQNAVLLGI